VLVRYADHELELEVADRGGRARMSGGRDAVAA
jgi:hypothetical protein